MIDQRDVPAILSEIFAQTPSLWESVRVISTPVFIVVISCGRILRSLNAPQRRRVHVTLPESVSPIRPDKDAHPSFSIHRTRYKPREKATATRFSWIIKRTRCRKAQVPYADLPIAFRRESAMFFHSPEKYAGLRLPTCRSKVLVLASSQVEALFQLFGYLRNVATWEEVEIMHAVQFRMHLDIDAICILFVRESAMINVRLFLSGKEIKFVELISISIFKSINYKDYINYSLSIPSSLVRNNFLFFLWKMIRIDKIAQMENIVNKRTSAKAEDIYFLRLLNLDSLIVFRSIASVRKWRGSLKSFWTIFPSSQLLHRVRGKFYRKLRAARASYDRLHETANRLY